VNDISYSEERLVSDKFIIAAKIDMFTRLHTT